ncbi:MAG: Uncharacterised protein [Opitutia bacterium UBA7350]|nr:MAG: Uncharacterised protein [Opitutae bacterium UBA7350]
MTNCLRTILDDAKTKLEGQLWPLNKALLTYFGIYLLLALPTLIIEMTASQEVVFFSSIFFELFLIPLLVYPVMVGIVCLGIALSRGEEIQVGSILGHYDKMWSLYGFQVLYFMAVFVCAFACTLLALAFVGSGFNAAVTIIIIFTVLLLGCLGVYICFAAPLIVDKDFSIIESIRCSIHAIHTSGKFFLLVRFIIMLSVWMVLGVFTLGIIYFWIFPRYIIAFGIIYRDLFDSETEAPKLKKSDLDGPLAKYS